MSNSGRKKTAKNITFEKKAGLKSCITEKKNQKKSYVKRLTMPNNESFFQDLKKKLWG